RGGAPPPELRGDAERSGTRRVPPALRPEARSRLCDPRAAAAARVPRGRGGRPPGVPWPRDHTSHTDRGPRRLRPPGNPDPLAHVGRGTEPSPPDEPGVARAARSRVRPV